MTRTLGLKGVDLSKYQTSTPPLDGLSFGIARASISVTADAMYPIHVANMRKAGLVVGAYHFGYDAETSAIKDQVAKFLSIASGADFLIIDQEASKDSTGRVSTMSDPEAQEFVDRVHDAGFAIGLYHSSSGFGGVKADFQWVADYRSGSVSAGYPRTAPTDGSTPVQFPGWDIWQWTSQGQIAGYADDLDLNWMNPASPLAKLLRLGYVTNASSDAAIAAATASLQAQLAQTQSSLADAIAQAAALNTTVTEQASTIEGLQAALAAAPAEERARIADLERARIYAL